MVSKVKAKNTIQTNESELMHIESQKETWSECVLEDGTRIRVRPVITEVRKLSTLDVDGRPVYHIRSAIITDVRHPEKKRTKKKGDI